MKKMLSALLAACIITGLMPMLPVTVSAAEENLVFKGAVIHGGEYQTSYGQPEDAINGILDLGWWSTDGVQSQYIVIKLAKVSKVSRIVAWLCAGSSSPNTYNVFEYSLNGVDWSSESRVLSGMSQLTEEDIYYGPDGIGQTVKTGYKRTCTFEGGTVTAQYIKIGNTRTTRMQIREIEIFGEEMEDIGRLSELSIQGYDLVPSFHELTLEYSITIGIDDPIPDKSTVTAISSNEEAAVEITQATETTPFIITVTPPDGGEDVVYKIHVTRAQAYDVYNLLNFIKDEENPENYFEGVKLTAGQYSNAIDGSLNTSWKAQTLGTGILQQLPWMSVDLGASTKVSAASVVMSEMDSAKINSQIWYSTSTADTIPPFYTENNTTTVINEYDEIDNPDGWRRITATSAHEDDYIGADSRHTVLTFEQPIEARYFAWSAHIRRNLRVHQFGLYDLTEEPFAEFDSGSIPGGVPVSGAFKIRNTTPSTTIAVKGVFILAVYDDGGSLYDVCVINKSDEGAILADAGKINVLAAPQSSKNIPAGYTAKLFMWDGLSGISPVISSASLPAE